MTRLLLALLAVSLLVLVVAVAVGRTVPVAQPPWQSDLPSGATVVFTAMSSRVGFLGYPVRIVAIGSLCITEAWSSPDGFRASVWTFVESKSCDVASHGGV